MNLQERRERAQRLRGIPLEAVLRAAGAKPDLHDKAKWHTSQGVLSVNGMKFINWNREQGGGGAIDLAMHLAASDFGTAFEWLAQRFPGFVSLPPAPMERAPLLMIPPATPSQLARVKHYLLTLRRLPTALLDPLIAAGDLYADSRANAVFLLLGVCRKPVGAELRSTTEQAWRGLAPGSRKDRGYFAIGPDDSGRVILCESAIDAISCAALHAGSRCISTAGARSNPAWLGPLLTHGYRIECGFDADPTGDHMAEAMIAQHPAIQRLRPFLHDWNDVLMASS